MSASSKSNGAVLPVLIGIAFLAIAGGLYAFFNGDGKPDAQMAGSNGQCAVSETVRNAVGAVAKGEVAAFSLLDEPVKLPPVSFKDKDGVEKTIADWSGRTVLMNLWATWCAPCRKEMPALQALNAELGGSDFEVVAVSVDQGAPEKPKNFYESIGLDTLGFYHDGSVETLFALKKESLAFGLPATLLIDSNGCVIGALNGPAEWASDDAKQLVKAAM